MDEVLMIPLIILGIIVIAFIAYLLHLAEKKRRERLQLLAKKLGLSYSRKKNRSHARRYRFLDDLDKGSQHYTFDVMTGDFKGHPISLFNYHYETYSTNKDGHRQTHHHYHNVAALDHSNDFPELRIYPEGFFSKIGQALGFDDIDFESVEFSKKFVVRSKDKKFAYDICHTLMMEYLLKHHRSTLEIEGNTVALVFDGKYKEEHAEEMLGRVVDIRELFPEYLYKS